jgi:hypothetical protein
MHGALKSVRYLLIIITDNHRNASTNLVSPVTPPNFTNERFAGLRIHM